MLHHTNGPLSAADLASNHVEQAHRQVEQALQTADQQIEALRARVTKKNAQLSEAKLRLQHVREDMQDEAASQGHHPSSLPDTESSQQTGTLSHCSLTSCAIWILAP